MSNAPLVPPFTPSELFALRSLVQKHKIAGAAKLLGLPRSAIASALAEAPIRNGSRALMRIALATVSAVA